MQICNAQDKNKLLKSLNALSPMLRSKMRCVVVNIRWLRYLLVFFLFFLQVVNFLLPDLWLWLQFIFSLLFCPRNINTPLFFGPTSFVPPLLIRYYPISFYRWQIDGALVEPLRQALAHYESLKEQEDSHKTAEVRERLMVVVVVVVVVVKNGVKHQKY